jgi:hypothetical protein
MRLVLSLLLLSAAVSAQAPEEPPVPSDSLRVSAIGCLKGRVFKATDRPRGEEADVVSGPDITGRSFRLNGPKALMEDVKKHDKKMVSVVGLIRKSALMEQGARIGNSRIVIGAPGSMEPGGRPPMPGVAVMDVSSVQKLAETCSP